MQMKILSCYGNLCITVMVALCQSMDYMFPPSAMAITRPLLAHLAGSETAQLLQQRGCPNT